VTPPLAGPGGVTVADARLSTTLGSKGPGQGRSGTTADLLDVCCGRRLSCSHGALSRDDELAKDIARNYF
jgi:hypothetical protein